MSTTGWIVAVVLTVPWTMVLALAFTAWRRARQRQAEINKRLAGRYGDGE